MSDDLSKGLYTYLQSVTAITDIVSDRVYPQHLPQNPVLPAITYTIISEDPVHDMQGSSGLNNATIQLDGWAETDDDRRELKREIRNALDGYKGAMGSVTVQAVLLVNRFNAFDDDIENYRSINEFMFWYTLSIPTF